MNFSIWLNNFISNYGLWIIFGLIMIITLIIVILFNHHKMKTHLKVWIVLPYLITICLTEFAGFLLYFIIPDVVSFFFFFLGMNIYVIIYTLYNIWDELFSKCPLCGKRHLMKFFVTRDDRYMTYHAYCPTNEKFIGAVIDTKGDDDHYYEMDNNKFGKEIKPIWKNA